MSVLIKGLNMPETCSDCNFCYDQMQCSVTGDRFFGDTWVRLEFDHTKQILPSCLLVEVSVPHGDLIDKNELYEKTAEWEAQALDQVEKHLHDEDQGDYMRWSAILNERSAFKFDVADAPVIVPAEEGED